MPLAKNYVCYSVQHGQAQGVSVQTLNDIGVGCNVTAVQAERIARFVAKALKVKLGKVYVKNTARGHGRKQRYTFGRSYSRDYIGPSRLIPSLVTLPHWILHRAKPFTIYYIVHEVAHLHPNAHGHESGFKRVERRALKRFGMGIRYMHAYPRELFALKGGRLLWEDPQQRALRMEREEAARLLRNGDGSIRALPGDRVEFEGRVWTVVTSDASKDHIQLEN